jgi:hypothetical protein
MSFIITRVAGYNCFKDLNISEHMKEWINGYDLLVVFSESTGSRFIE